MDPTRACRRCGMRTKAKAWAASLKHEAAQDHVHVCGQSVWPCGHACMARTRLHLPAPELRACRPTARGATCPCKGIVPGIDRSDRQVNTPVCMGVMSAAARPCLPASLHVSMHRAVAHMGCLACAGAPRYASPAPLAACEPKDAAGSHSKEPFSVEYDVVGSACRPARTSATRTHKLILIITLA